MDNKLSKIGKEIGLALVIVIAMLLPRIFELDKFVTTDETIWLMRSSNYYYALGQRDFENIGEGRADGGVVTMWVGTAALLVEYPQYRSYGQGYFENFLVFNRFIDEKGFDPLVILSTSRIIMVILLSTVIGLAFHLAKGMIGVYPAVVGFLLISIDPWYLALSRISHLDAPQATFQFASLLAFISFMYFGKKPSMLAISGLLGGVAALSKLPALISGLAFAFVSAREYLQDVILDKPKKALEYFSVSRKYGKMFAVWIIFFFLAIALFYPYAWVMPGILLQNMANNLVHHANNLETMVSAMNIESVDNDFTLPLNYYTRYLRGYLWHTTPVILLGLAASIFAYLFRMRLFKDQIVRKLVGAIFWFVAIYTVVMTIPPKSSPRYYLPVHLCLDLIAGMGLVTLSLELSSRLKLKREKLFSYGFAAIFLGVQLVGVSATSPYYFTYYNPLLGGSKTAGETTFLGLGEGLNLVGEYLNGKPDSETLTVMSWIGIGPLSFFFDGDTVLLRFDNDSDSGNSILHLEDVDYLAIYVQDIDYLIYNNDQLHNRIHKRIIDLLANVEPEHSVWINEIEYARIYNVAAIEDHLIK